MVTVPTGQIGFRLLRRLKRESCKTLRNLTFYEVGSRMNSNRLKATAEQCQSIKTQVCFDQLLFDPSDLYVISET